MSVTDGPNKGFMINALTGDTFDVEFRRLLRGLDALLMCAVISRTLTVPPGSPANGDCYIVGAAPTGAWAGNAKSIAIWTTDNPATPGGLWEFYVPKAGFLAYSVADAALYEYSGTAWVVLTGGGGGGSVFVASGAGHASGLVPDPGATAGVTKFLREDATFAVPAGGGGGGGSPMNTYYHGPNSTTQLNIGAFLPGAGILTFQFYLPASLATGHVYLGVWGGDGGNSYDFGVIDVNGNLVLNTGPVVVVASGAIPWVQGLTTLPPGQYYFCIAAANGASTLQIIGFNPGFPASHPESGTAPNAGPTLPATVVPYNAIGYSGSIIAPNFALVT